jgi:arylsulfatase
VLQPLSFNGALFAHFHAGIERPTTNPSGAQVPSAEIRVDKEGQFGTGGTVTLRMGEKIIGKGRFEKQVPFRCTVNETFDVGCDTVSSFPDLYESPFPFTGKLKRILVDISNAEPQGLAAAAKLAMAMQ